MIASTTAHGPGVVLVAKRGQRAQDDRSQAAALHVEITVQFDVLASKPHAGHGDRSPAPRVGEDAGGAVDMVRGQQLVLDARPSQPCGEGHGVRRGRRLDQYGEAVGRFDKLLGEAPGLIRRVEIRVVILGDPRVVRPDPDHVLAERRELAPAWLVTERTG
ncbi:hypothetical protein E1265_26195 [Streptomyces sp. 8K308]|uniref:hypothetical protein n=1 Tax=Streptomyces sp. 8K308 TaxID=2530388 RepID=UPI0010F0BA64|nr:hypothetical protein [Streptomyces sp. 8K308]TDC15817.1 hypothetical protein E1265_26195 [Streptomyces sp. 8K308]